MGYTELYGLLEKEGHVHMLIDGFLPTSLADAYTHRAILFIDNMLAKGNWLSDDDRSENTNRNENR